jgi:exosome complex RNA-binding protein Rrp4
MRTILSWFGYTKAMRLQGNIKIEFQGFMKVDDRLIAKARAIDTRSNIEVEGIAARLPKFQTEFIYEILAAKAIRNALKKIIDPDVLAQVVKYAKERKLSQELPLRESARP